MKDCRSQTAGTSAMYSLIGVGLPHQILPIPPRSMSCKCRRCPRCGRGRGSSAVWAAAAGRQHCHPPPLRNYRQCSRCCHPPGTENAPCRWAPGPARSCQPSSAPRRRGAASIVLNGPCTARKANAYACRCAATPGLHGGQVSGSVDSVVSMGASMQHRGEALRQAEAAAHASAVRAGAGPGRCQVPAPLPRLPGHPCSPPHPSCTG